MSSTDSESYNTNKILEKPLFSGNVHGEQAFHLISFDLKQISRKLVFFSRNPILINHVMT